MRGEYPMFVLTFERGLGSPPLARGIHFFFPMRGEFQGITPACAGNTFRVWHISGGRGDHPRLRGEYSWNLQSDSRVLGSPPLARGIPAGNYFPVFVLGITPACAGNTKDKYRFFRWPRDHPRLRGEYAISFSILSMILGSPPLARGIPSLKVWKVSIGGITPACAGNTSWKTASRPLSRDHPRLRGEYKE